jgi:hypothetical protein
MLALPYLGSMEPSENQALILGVSFRGLNLLCPPFEILKIYSHKIISEC